jgi:uncharacterized membrane protein YkoI
MLPVLALAMGLQTALAAPAITGTLDGSKDMRSVRLAAAGVSLDEAVAMVRNRYGGKVIGADTVEEHGRKVHVIKLLSDKGRVRTVKVDAESGKIR